MAISSQTESILRFGFFFTVLLLMYILEVRIPRKKLLIPRFKRWTNNLGITFLNSILIGLIFPVSSVMVALYAEKTHQGIFNSYMHINKIFAIFASMLFLDFVIYLQHVMFHAIPIFWRIHRVHHLDLDLDVTTGVRFHPLEIIFSLIIKFAAILIIGAPALAVIAFQILLNVSSMFNHSNIKLSEKIDKRLRNIIVTPDMHCIHHSVIPNETNSNFGFNLSFWDRVFGTYRAHPCSSYQDIKIGLDSHNNPAWCTNLISLLFVPFIKNDSHYPINRR